MSQTHNASNWNAHYRSRVGESYPAHCRQAYRPFLETLRYYIKELGYTRPRVLVREEGCGIATITKILAQDANPSKVAFQGFDYNTDQVRNSRENIKSLKHTHIDIREGNMFHYQGAASIIHAHGVLEHFSDEEIELVLNRQREEADVVIHYVPLEGWGEGSYGDERLLPLSHWVATFNPKHYYTFNDGKDAVLVWS